MIRKISYRNNLLLNKYIIDEYIELSLNRTPSKKEGGYDEYDYINQLLNFLLMRIGHPCRATNQPMHFCYLLDKAVVAVCYDSAGKCEANHENAHNVLK